MNASSLVYFEGRWSSAERALIEAAAKAAEQARGPEVIRSLGAPWVALAYSDGDGRDGEGRVYFASRHGSSEALRAESAEALARKMRQFVASGSSNP